MRTGTSGKLTDERFHKLSTDYEVEQAGLQAQAAILREEIEEVEGKSADVDRFLSVVRQYTDIGELTPRILHEFVEKISSFTQRPILIAKSTADKR